MGDLPRFKVGSIEAKLVDLRADTLDNLAGEKDEAVRAELQRDSDALQRVLFLLTGDAVDACYIGAVSGVPAAGEHDGK